MKNVSSPGNRPVIFLATKDSDGSLSRVSSSKQDQSRWVYFAARIFTLIFSLILFFTAFVFGANGSWDIATLFFILSVLMVIPFIMLGRKLIEVKKAKRSF